MTPAPAAGPDGVPGWLRGLADRAGDLTVRELSRLGAAPSGMRASAVLVLFGEGERGPDVLLIERSARMRKHAGQPAFPGGAADPGDGGPAATALREAEEETGLDATGVQVLAVLPELWVPVSGFVVAPVLAWWRRPSPVHPRSQAEVSLVVRVPMAELTDPANRFRVAHPSGYVGPAFAAGGMLVWGFTAGLLDRLLAAGGLERPWDVDDVRPLPESILRLAGGGVPTDPIEEELR